MVCTGSPKAAPQEDVAPASHGAVFRLDVFMLKIKEDKK